MINEFTKSDDLMQEINFEKYIFRGKQEIIFQFPVFLEEHIFNFQKYIMFSEVIPTFEWLEEFCFNTRELLMNDLTNQW